jgi:hypothetical protein
MKHQYALKIESPCSENWDEMLPTDMGKFCLHCQKTVIDFSEMTDYEIAMYLHQHKNENLCGKIKVTQSEKPFIFVEPQLTSSPVKRYVMVMLAALASVSPNMATSTPLPLYSLMQTNTQTEKPPLKDSTVLNSISGILTDKETGKPIAYATIVLSVKLVLEMELQKIGYQQMYLFNMQKSKQFEKEEILKAKQDLKDISLTINYLEEIDEELRKTPLVCKTDEKGYFYLALPPHFKEMDFCLHIRLLNKKAKDAEGKENIWEERTVNPLLVHYKRGHYYKETAIVIEETQIEFRTGMIIRPHNITPPTEIND